MHRNDRKSILYLIERRKSVNNTKFPFVNAGECIEVPFKALTATMEMK